MNAVTTSGCSKHGHSEIKLEYGEGVLRQDVEFLAQTMVGMVASGSVFRNGETFQVGWLRTRIRKGLFGPITLEEPDMVSFPVRWVRGVTSAVRHLRLHKDVVESVMAADEMVLPEISHSCIACTELTNSDFVLTRFEPEGRDSGWFFGCSSEAHDHDDEANLAAVSLFEAVSVAPKALPFLALPPGITVVVAGDQIDICRGDQILPLIPGSYLDALLNKRMS